MTKDLNLSIYHFDAAVTLEDSGDFLQEINAREVTLHTASGVHHALTWLPKNTLQSGNGEVRVGRIKACDIFTPMGESVLLMTSFETSFGSSALAHVSVTACPIAGEVEAIRKLVSSVSNISLRIFIENALSEVNAFRWFWTCPASLHHHHADAGGLARHSRHVAEQAALAVSDQLMQRDFAIAFGLLHDYGKIWAYEEGQQTDIASRLGHEQIGYEKLLPEILRLREGWHDGGIVMQSLLSGQWKRDGKAPIQAVGNVVRSLDQYSAESDMVKRQNRTTRWRPVSV